jgi:hypothetical protein
MGIQIAESVKSIVPEKYVFIFNFLSEYETPRDIQLGDVSIYAIPKSATRFFMDNSNLKSLTDRAIRDAYLSHDWLYYCRETPIWATKIQEYGGIIDTINKRVAFPSDDIQEQFYNRYGLEQDEQSREIHERHGIVDSYEPYSLTH